MLVQPVTVKGGVSAGSWAWGTLEESLEGLGLKRPLTGRAVDKRSLYGKVLSRDSLIQP